MVYRLLARLEQSREMVYDALADLEGHHEWSGIHAGWVKPPPAYADMAVGDEAHHAIVIWGVPAELRWTVTRHDRPDVFELRGTARMGATMRLTATFENGEPGTLLTIETELDGGPLAGLGGESFARVVRQAQTAAIDGLRKVLQQP